jgi:hypothetical protein
MTVPAGVPAAIALAGTNKQNKQTSPMNMTMECFIVVPFF